MRFWQLIVCGLTSLVFVASSLAAAPDAPLADAVERQDIATMRRLLQENGAKVSQPQADGSTALHWACYYDNLEAVQLLVEAHADVKATNRFGVAPPSLACTNGNEAIVKLLLEAGADPNTTLRGGETVLMTA